MLRRIGVHPFYVLLIDPVKPVHHSAHPHIYRESLQPPQPEQRYAACNLRPHALKLHQVPAGFLRRCGSLKLSRNSLYAAFCHNLPCGLHKIGSSVAQSARGKVAGSKICHNLCRRHIEIFRTPVFSRRPAEKPGQVFYAAFDAGYVVVLGYYKGNHGLPQFLPQNSNAAAALDGFCHDIVGFRQLVFDGAVVSVKVKVGPPDFPEVLIRAVVDDQIGAALRRNCRAAFGRNCRAAFRRNCCAAFGISARLLPGGAFLQAHVDYLSPSNSRIAAVRLPAPAKALAAVKNVVKVKILHTLIYVFSHGFIPLMFQFIPLTSTSTRATLKAVMSSTTPESLSWKACADSHSGYPLRTFTETDSS